MGSSDTLVVITGESLVTILADAAAELLRLVLPLFGSVQTAALCPIFWQLKHWKLSTEDASQLVEECLSQYALLTGWTDIASVYVTLWALFIFDCQAQRGVVRRS